MKSKAESVTLFFDYDGTLHDCLRIYAPAFRRVYQELLADGLTPPEVSHAKIRTWLGLSVQEMWDDFMPKLAPKRQAHYGGRIGEEMLHLIQEGQAVLYPGTEEVLDILRDRGCQMVFLSNCPHAYMDAHRRQFWLDLYFDAFFCAEDFPDKAKWEIYEAVQDRFPGQHIVIGDRWQDMEIANRFGLPAIGCSYGYGTPEELSGADLCIQTIADLPETVAAIAKS